MKKGLLLILLFFNLIGKSQTNILDSLALIDIYNATNGPSWTNSTNWLNGPVKTWYGVMKHTIPQDTTRVAQVNIQNNNLTGYIPLSIGDLTAASEINFSNNNLTGNIPQTIGKLNHLVIFIANNNQLSGNLTDSICKITSLTSLHLYNNNFTGKIPDSMNQFSNLTNFYIYNNQIDGMPDFSGIPNLNNADYRVANNLLTFEDIEPNMTLGFFICCPQNYTPQSDSINNPIDTTIQVDSTFIMHCAIGGQHNIYQWSKNSIDILGATDSVCTINQAVALDSGMYLCRVTNSVVSGLTFYRRPITVHIDTSTGFLEEQSNVLKIYPNPATHLLYIECSNKNTQILITDILGNIKIKQQTNNHLATIDISGLDKGLYFAKVGSEKGIVVRKFVKQ